MGNYLREVARRLIGFDTVSGKSNRAAMHYLADELDRHGWQTELQQLDGERFNLVAFDGPPEPGGLIISGHIDTVPFEGQPGWTRDPLRMEVEDERVFGRGSSDMKTFLAQCLDAAARKPGPLRRPVVFLFTTDEETGCLGAASLCSALPQLLKQLPLPRLAWIGEPTSYEIFRAHKGIVYFAVTVSGRGGHSSRPQQGVNAIAAAAKVIDAIGRHEMHLRGASPSGAAALFPDSPHTAFNFGRIAGGTAPNVIAEECRFEISYRPVPDVDPLESYRALCDAITKQDLRDYSGGEHRASVHVSEPMVVPGLLSRPNSPLEQVLSEVLQRPAQHGAPFATDGGQFMRGGIESVICGPGDLAQAHQVNESISRHAFERGTELIVSVIRRLCGQ